MISSIRTKGTNADGDEAPISKIHKTLIVNEI